MAKFNGNNIEAVWNDDENLTEEAMGLNEVRKGMQDDKCGHIHHTKAGESMPIYKMDDDHLLNTIGLFSYRLAQNIKNNSSFAGHESMMDAIMEGPDFVKRKASSVKNYISKVYLLLGRYVFEAVRRGLTFEATSKMVGIIGAMNDLINTRPDGTTIKEIAGPEETKDHTEKGSIV